MSNADRIDAQRHYRIMARLRGRMYELGEATPDELAWVDHAVVDAGDRLARWEYRNHGTSTSFKMTSLGTIDAVIEALQSAPRTFGCVPSPLRGAVGPRRPDARQPRSAQSPSAAGPQ